VNVRILLAAEDELVEAANWYEDRQPGLGERFLDEYQAAVLRILAAATSFARIETTRLKRDIRRCRLNVFPYYVPFELTEGEILILAIAHSKRRPNYWIRRK
jgi:plasmid stabilization system protein ParE